MIDAADIHKRFGATHVLRGASLTVEKGELAALIGGSGSGKSTLLRCINALESFDAGAIRVGDITLAPQSNSAALSATHLKLRRRIGMVFQQFNLFPHMSALENVMCGPVYAQGMPREKAVSLARQLLDRVGLADKADARPASLSGGQQQRVAIARTLANEPEAILFDEPTSALDPRMTAEVLAVMADLAAGGQTMIVVSHHMGFVRRSATTVHMLHAGRVIESGPPAQVFESPARDETREFLSHAME